MVKTLQFKSYIFRYPLPAPVLDICWMCKLFETIFSLPPTGAPMPGKEDGSLTVDFNRFQETMEGKKWGGNKQWKKNGRHGPSPWPPSPPPYHHHYHHYHHHPQIFSDVGVSQWRPHRWPGIDSCPTLRHHVRAQSQWTVEFIEGIPGLPLKVQAPKISLGGLYSKVKVDKKKRGIELPSLKLT